MRFVIGTRGSKLALWQANYVADALKAQGAETVLRIIDTKGDQNLSQALSALGSKGLFTEELEVELREGKIDLAVHSAKDMPSFIPEDLELIAFSEREKVNDVVLSLRKDFTIAKALKEGLVIGTSSTRRRACLKHYYPGIKLVDMRGNLQTRMRKMEEGACDGMILAYAGVFRMEMSEFITEELNLEQFTPAVGQGCLAIETAKSLADNKKKFIRSVLNNIETEYCLLAERACLTTLEGGCSVPVFALANLSNENLSISGGVVSLDGTQRIVHKVDGHKNDAVALGKKLADAIIAQGGKKILDEIKRQKNEK